MEKDFAQIITVEDITIGYIPGSSKVLFIKTGQGGSIYGYENKYLDLAGLGGRGLSVHKLRHTAATLMYQSGKVDIRVLKDILGHEQLNTTQIYTHVVDRNLEEAMNNNPLSEIKVKTSVLYEEDD